MTTPFLTRKEAANAFRVSRQTLDSWIKGDTIRAVRLGRRVLVPSSEIDRLSQITS